MITIRPAQARGKANFGWLDSRQTFSLKINGQTLQAGDGAAITQERDIELAATTDDPEILLFDLA